MITFIARSASSLANFNRSMLIFSLTIGRFGGDSSRRTIFGGDSTRRVTFGGDFVRTIGDIRRGGGTGGGGGAGWGTTGSATGAKDRGAE